MPEVTSRAKTADGVNLLHNDDWHALSLRSSIPTPFRLPDGCSAVRVCTLRRHVVHMCCLPGGELLERRAVLIHHHGLGSHNPWTRGVLFNVVAGWSWCAPDAATGAQGHSFVEQPAGHEVFKRGSRAFSGIASSEAIRCQVTREYASVFSVE
jgi:hypothetical protein